MPACRYLVEPLEERTLLSFGLTTTSSSFTVDTGAQVAFSVARSGGDLTSVKYNGVEMEAPFSSTSRFSHYESGLSSSCVVSAATDPAGNWIKITCDDTGTSGVGVIQYYIAHKGDNDVYMATYAPGPASPSPGEMRFIMYLNWNTFTNHPPQSDTSGGQSVIESQDVFENTTTGQTHSKYYGEIRAIDETNHGATGSANGLNYGTFMFMGNRESSSGGPFFKDIDFQSTGASVELYNYMFSGHSQTENFRPGLQGPYALAITNGGAPVAPNYSFIDGLGLSGWVSPAGRGMVKGNASGVQGGHMVTVGLSNATAQYWGTPDASGNYTISGVKPGTYVETLYEDELAVGTLPAVTVSAGATTTQNITDTFFIPAAASTIFRLGAWDGTPIGFLNADKIGDMHPSDSRMTPWVNTTFTVGTSTDDQWPLAQWKDASLNAINRITFNLTAAQVTAMTLRIGITRAGAGGRPIISTNGGNYSNAPAASTQPTARGVTLGNWRGNNTLYTYGISSSSLHAGTNTIDIQIASGSSSTESWLQPWVTYDAIELVTTSSLTNTPVVKSIAVTPANPAVLIGNQLAFTATAKDQFGNVTPANFMWTSSRGSVDGAGVYTAPLTTGADSVTATSGTISGNSGVNVTTISSIQGTGNSDAILLRRNGANLDVYVNSASPTYSVPFAALGALSIAGLNGNDTVTLDYANGSPVPTGAISIGGGTGASTLDIEGTATDDAITLAGGSFSLSAASAAAISLNVNAGAILAMTAAQGAGALNIAGHVTVAANGATPLVIHSLNIAGGTLDLANNSIIIDYTGTSPVASVRAYLAAGFNGGRWNGTGIASSSAAADGSMLHALGYAEASDLGIMTFLNQPVDSSAVLIRYTKYGDSNLDGTVDIGNDFSLFLDGLATQNASSWVQGDYTYDGKIDLGNDFNLLLSTLQNSSSPGFTNNESTTSIVKPSATANVIAQPATAILPFDAALFSHTGLDKTNADLFT